MYQSIMCNFDNIYEAYLKAHRGKSNDSYVIKFDNNKLYNLNKIRNMLLNKEWDSLFIYYRFKIYEPKERVIDAMEFIGRIVQHILCDKILKPFFEDRLVKECAACRENKGTDYARNLVKSHLVKFLRNNDNGYVLKIDIKKFFPSIDHDVLKSLLNDFDDDIKSLLYYIIDKSPSSKGIPIGNQTSQWFALFYLNKIDRLIKEKYKIKYYCRYMDDLIIIHEDKKCLFKIYKELREYACDKLKLEFNSKSQIRPIHSGFSFLGWRFIVNDKKIILKISNEKKKFRIKKVRELNKKLKANVITYEEYKTRKHSLKNYLKNGNTYNFLFKNGLWYE